ncbi:MAG: DUF853 family protein [Planctomycetes bacterium]|nr:DUF853 family protein [Planctomycetota bacterium]
MSQVAAQSAGLAHPSVADQETRTDPRVAAFCSPAGPEIFHSVAYTHEIWRQDPFDVEIIHAEAREQFQRLVNRATTPGQTAGRILLLQGESGSGKTHLMRAFRNYVHSQGLGYCGYLQMTTMTNNYARYVLNNLIESLDQPYFEAQSDQTGLMRLANALAETPHAILPGELTRLREDNLNYPELAHFIDELASLVQQDEPFSRLDLDLIRALLYLQRNDPGIKSRILKYLRCQDLSDADRNLLGGMVPRKDEADPLTVIELLGRLMWSAGSGALVIFIDQLEEMTNLNEAPQNFRRAMSTVCAIANQVPSSVLVISCLEDFYTGLKAHLTKPVLDRIERDPEPIQLKSHRVGEEVQALISRRLMHLFDVLDVPYVESEPTYPIPNELVQKLTNLRTRDVIDECRQFRERCIQEQKIVEDIVFPPDKTSQDSSSTDLSQKWNDFRAADKSDPPDEEASLAELLGWAIKETSAEISSGHWFEVEPKGRMIPVEVHGADNIVTLLQVGICNKNPQGGALSRQIKELAKQAGEHTPVIVRSTAFPSSPKTEVSKQIGQLISHGGRRAVVEDSDWRTILALQKFREQHQKDPKFPDWLKEEKPLSSLKSLKTILDLDNLKPPQGAQSASVGPTHTQTASQQKKPSPDNAADRSAAQETPWNSGPIRVGKTGGLTSQPVHVDPHELTRHVAFLGGSGSGKTTVALNLVEQLLLQGIPAVLLDRKGDLCGYARPEIWSRSLSDSALAARRDFLQDKVEVAVFTPGNPLGRSLAIPIVPEGMDQLPSPEQSQVANYAAFALGSMMAYKDRGQDASRLAILQQAILFLGASRIPITLENLINVLDDQDPGLVNSIGRLETRLFNRLIQDLQTLLLNKKELLASQGERLDVDNLLGLNRPPTSKTRLSIISTKFLGDNANVDFWVAQLLLELIRWTSRHPNAALQAVFLFDEADAYLPALRKPATKEPMESLLRRARSAGIGLLLASQSPGDFDYRCRDNIRSWFLGRITQPTSLAKMKPMLNDCKVDIASRLPSQQTGQFFLVREGNVTGLQAERSVMVTEQIPEDEILALARFTREAQN